MTDKVQKIRAFLVGIADTDGVSTILARAIEKKILPYIDSLQEEPVSNIEAYQNRWGKSNGYREPVSEDLGEYINELSKQFPEVSFAKLSRIAVRVSRWQRNQDVKNKLPKVISRTDLDEYAYQCAYDMSNDWAIENPTWHDVEDACKLGANWQKEQFEKNRIAACDRQTEEEAEREQDFVMGIIENEHRKPTFDDAIKYGMRLQRENMMKDAVLCGVDGWFINNKRHCRKNGRFHKYYESTITHDKKLPMENGKDYRLIVIKED